MKTIFALSILIGSFSSFAGHIEVKVNGMVCSMCAQGIQKKFSGDEALKKLDVDLDKKVVHIETQDGKDISNEVITKRIQEAGYNVGTIERK